MTLTCFPRGGKKSYQSTSIELKKKKKYSKTWKSKDKRKISYTEKNNVNYVVDIAERLSIATLCEGLVVLGRISKITNYYLNVSLPGGLNGQVQITDLCKTYSDLLESIIRTEQVDQFKTLSELYRPGDYVICYIKSVSSEEKLRISLSLEPHLINQNVNGKGLVKGTNMVCAISSIEDHGYIVDTGIPNVRAFIAIKDVGKEKQYFLGKQVFCVIKEINAADNSYVINLSMKQKKLNRVSTCAIESLDNLMPGTKVMLNVTSTLLNGLKVSFGKNNVGFVNQIYLNNHLSSYTEGTEIIGTLMYIQPILKYGYFTLVTNKAKGTFKIGHIVANACVSYREGNNIVLKLGSDLHGLVSLRRIGVDFKKIATKFAPDTTHRCRILGYNWMENMYICTMERELLNKKFFTSSDLSPGDTLDVKLTSINTETGYIGVSIGKINGSIAPEQLSDEGPSILSKLKVGQEIKSKVLYVDKERNKVQFTAKESLINSDLPILCNFGEAKCGSRHVGTIVQINKNGLLIYFAGQVRGWVPQTALNKDTANTNWNYSIGQTITTVIEKVNEANGKIELNVISDVNDKKESSFSIGDSVEGTVTESSPEGILLRIDKGNKNGSEIGFLPVGHLAPCMEIARFLTSKYVPGDSLSALIFSTEPTLILTRTYLPQKEYQDFDKLKIGDCIPCSIKDITQDGLRVILPIRNYKTFGFVSYNKVSNVDLIHTGQILFVKIMNMNRKERSLDLSMSLDKIWNKEPDQKVKMMTSVDLLNLYFNKIAELRERPYYKNRPISSVNLGQRVAGIVDKITVYGLVLKLENNLLGTVSRDHYAGDFKVGDKVSGAVLWVNYVHELLNVTLLPKVVNNISAKQQKLRNLPLETLLRGDIIMVTNWFALVLLKGGGHCSLAALPVRRHANDLLPDLEPYAFMTRIKCYVVLNRDESDVMPICLLRSVFEWLRGTSPSRKISKEEANVKSELGTLETDRVSSWTIKSNEKDIPRLTDDTRKNERKKDTVNERLRGTDRERQPIRENDESKKRKRSKRSNDEAMRKVEAVNVLEPKIEDNVVDDEKDTRKVNSKISRVPECGFYWDSKPDLDLASHTHTTSESEVEEKEPKRKKKKLSAAERREEERQKEREEALAGNRIPNSVDQFDRLVLSSPDSSLIWIQYMTYHLQATEIEKARAIARRAVKTISFREEDEKLNIWNAWLNLECKFGTTESLNDVFQEAVRANDALKVYSRMLMIYQNAGRQLEVEKLVNIIVSKFKENPRVWSDCGAALLKMGLKEKSRRVMQSALQSLPALEHVNLMVRFANLEGEYGDKERSQTLFEQILSSYPKRVDVWSSYVDSIIKSGDIDIARKVLERAIVQALPPRKMKTLYKKFVAFEEKHGTSEDVARVQEMAARYVENICGDKRIIFPSLRSRKRRSMRNTTTSSNVLDGNE